jgi:hypothetical protein
MTRRSGGPAPPVADLGDWEIFEFLPDGPVEE